MKTLTISAVTTTRATGTLTSDNTNVSNGDTVTIGTTVYTFKTALTPTEGEVLIGTSADASLLNLTRAINHTGEPDVDYSCAAANEDVIAANSITSHAFAVTAIVPGTVGNAIATTETSSHLSWGAATLASGSDSVSITGALSDATYTQPAQRLTINEYPTGNASWSRNIRTTSDGTMIMRNGAEPVIVTLASLGLMALALEPSLTWDPRIDDSDQPADASCVHSSTAASFSVVASSELTKSYRWEYLAPAAGTITSDNTNVANNDTVVIGSKTYTFKTTLTPTEGEVLIGADADASLLNLIRAINHSGTPDTDYKCAAANTQVSAATAVTSHAFAVTALTAGSAGNAIATTETSSHLSWGASTLTGGGWTPATGTINGCAYTNDTTATLTCTPTTTGQTGLSHRCLITTSKGVTATDSAELTIT